MNESTGLDLWAVEPEKSQREMVVLSVGMVTKQIRRLLEREVGEVWIKGRYLIGKAPGSGHLYFSLKDEEAVINAVMFRADVLRLGFRPEDGQAVQLFGRITVYEARGQYQIIAMEMRPQGKGTLQERFEALKRKLQVEGLFAQERKRPLPVFPEKVGIVTALQGAVIQDFCRIMARRAPGVIIQVYGCRVQGAGAAVEVAEGIAQFNRQGEVDVIVVARGGGSLEDLWAFNEEVVARALAGSEIPTISAVGHETDFTIADFVADLRAPTPSAAAELITRDWLEWLEEIGHWSQRLQRATRLTLQTHREQWRRLAESFVFREPIRIVQQWQQRVDDLQLGLGRGLIKGCAARRHDLEKMLIRWQQIHPQKKIDREGERVDQWEARLKSLGPDATLARGFAILKDEQGKVIKETAQVKKGQRAEVHLAKGHLQVSVERVLETKSKEE